MVERTRDFRVLFGIMILLLLFVIAFYLVRALDGIVRQICLSAARLCSKGASICRLRSIVTRASLPAH